jgi:lycopene cyclase domain-containing protein
MYTYLLVNAIAIAFPLTFTFYKKVAYNTKLRYILPAIATTAALFIVWDMLFTHLGVWGFNSQYLIGFSVFNLPIEEILFFICIPYASIFIYESLIAFKVKDVCQPYQNAITLILFIASSIICFLNFDKYYTASTFGFGAIFWLLHLTVIKKNYLSRFYLAYLIILVPFFITNGILTGTGLESPVVWYNDNENLGIRILTIPIEDVFYGMLLIAASVTLVERKMNRFS